MSRPRSAARKTRACLLSVAVEYTYAGVPTRCAIRRSGTRSQYSSPRRRTKWFTGSRRRAWAGTPIQSRPSRSGAKSRSTARRRAPPSPAAAAIPSPRSRRSRARQPGPPRAASERDGEDELHRVRDGGIARQPGRRGQVAQSAEGQQQAVCKPAVEPVGGVVGDAQVHLETEPLRQPGRVLRVEGLCVHHRSEDLEPRVVPAPGPAAGG